VANVVSRTVEVCVFKRERGVPVFLLLKRSDNDPLYAGIWQFITGSVNDGEEAPEAALRELFEETELRPERFWSVPYVSNYYTPADDTVHLSPVFAAEVGEGARPKLSPEHEQFLWCHRPEAEEKLVWPGQRQGLGIVHEYIVGGQEASRLLALQI